MKRFSKFFTPLAVLFFASFLLAACGSGQADEGTEIYCLSADETKILPEKRTVDAGDNTDTLLSALVRQLSALPESGDLKAALPDEGAVLSANFDAESGQISVYVADSYKTLSGSRETLARACVVKTLLSALPDAQSVMFYSGTDPLTDTTGRAYGAMNRDTFVGDFGKDQAELLKTDLTIYYASADGEKLVPLARNVHYSTNTNIEKLVIENLAEEPAGSEARAVFTASSEVLHISTTDGICYVDLDNNYFTQAANVTENVAIYSLVDSLCALDGVNKVQITAYVSGKPVTGDGTYSGLYEPDMELVAAD